MIGIILIEYVLFWCIFIIQYILMENYYLEGIFLSNKMMIDKFMFGDESWRIQINYCIIFIMKYNIQSVWINEYVFLCYWDQSLLYINYVRGKQREVYFVVMY